MLFRSLPAPYHHGMGKLPKSTNARAAACQSTQAGSPDFYSFPQGYPERYKYASGDLHPTLPGTIRNPIRITKMTKRLSRSSMVPTAMALNTLSVVNIAILLRYCMGHVILPGATGYWISPTPEKTYASLIYLIHKRCGILCF